MPISGKKMLKRFKNNGWRIKNKKGSHIKVYKKIKYIEYIETIPMHKELKKGMESALLKRLKEVT